MIEIRVTGITMNLIKERNNKLNSKIYTNTEKNIAVGIKTKCPLLGKCKEENVLHEAE